MWSDAISTTRLQALQSSGMKKVHAEHLGRHQAQFTEGMGILITLDLRLPPPAPTPKCFPGVCMARMPPDPMGVILPV
jgi:hypothetical protein